MDFIKDEEYERYVQREGVLESRLTNDLAFKKTFEVTENFKTLCECTLGIDRNSILSVTFENTEIIQEDITNNRNHAVHDVV